MINWKVSSADLALIKKIADRAVMEMDADLTTTIMDITATHMNGIPLRLQEMLEAPKLDFLHDIYGIAMHLNRKTGQMEDCFLPRFAA
ncbi:hypothetical protein B0T40_09690 [Chromobacterium haemolyticum]|uniref:DUF6874 family protein n=1 Tax=Chromobacterium haemolyticum TaxID=394935 RepID=UPI0009DB2CBF|nr:hypothetical protein [Chromobacterium haemolyticum]OQS36657.1 hypothetical protein B0T40_09690 [Chromobacterium haemolyticum]